jgi:predicted small metal-binding protein
LQLEQELSTYLERHANTRTKEMTRIASDIVDELREQVCLN